MKGSDAFKPEAYGSIITVEKTLSKKAASLKLLNEAGKTVATSVDELHAITDQVSLFVFF